MTSVPNLPRDLTKANDETQGKWPVDIPRPRQMASLWADWTWRTGPLEGFGAGAGVRYQSSAAGAADNSLKIDPQLHRLRRRPAL